MVSAEAPRLATGEEVGGRTCRRLREPGAPGGTGVRTRAARVATLFEIYGEEVTPTKAEYEALLTASMSIDWRFRVALVIAHGTGHRIGAIRKLRWADIDMEARIIRWRAENVKTGYEHRTPVTAEVLAVLEEARMQNPKGGNFPVLPAPKDPSRCLDRSRVRVWWDKAQRLAGLEPKRGRGWHSRRRKFASDLMDQPLKVLSQLGGWKTARTVLPVLPEGRRGPAQEGRWAPAESPLLAKLAGVNSLELHLEVP